MVNIDKLINELGDPDSRKRSEAALNLGEMKSLLAIEPLLKLIESETDTNVAETVIEALEKIKWCWSDEVYGEDYSDDKKTNLDLRDPAQAALQKLRDSVKKANSAVTLYREEQEIMKDTCANPLDVAKLWGVRRAVDWLLTSLKSDSVDSEEAIRSLFRISDDPRPQSIQIELPASLYDGSLRQDIAGLSDVPGSGTLVFILEVLRLTAPDQENASEAMQTVHKVARAVLDRFSHLELVDMGSYDYDCRPDYNYLKTFNKLKTLRCSYAYDGNLAVLEHLPEIETLELLKCQITDKGMSCISSLPILKKLVIDDGGLGGKPGCEISINGARNIGGLEQLESLTLQGLWCFVDASLEHLISLTKLKQLSLHRTGITDVGVDSLIKLKLLESLDLTATDITEEAIARIRFALPECTIYEPDYEDPYSA